MISRINQLKIGPRLVLCFAVIVLLMFVGNILLVWQFFLVNQQSDRVTALARELAAVSRFQSDILSVDARLDLLAKSEDLDALRREAVRLRLILYADSESVRDSLAHLPSDVPRDIAVLPAVEAVKITLPPQLDAVIALGVASDWDAVRLRLANEKAPLEASTSDLVRNVQQQVNDELANSVAQAERVKRRILLIVPSTTFVTLLASTLLGLAITRSISDPLRQLLQGSTALARGDFNHQVQLSGNDELAHLGTVFNETTAKLRELYRQIQSSEAYLAEAQRLSHLGSWAWQVAGREVLHLSDEWYRTYGFDPKQGMPAWEEGLRRIHPEDRGTWEGAIERAIRERSDYNLEFRIVLPGGTLKWVHTVGHPVFSAAGELVQFIGSSMDITERKHAEEELQQLVDFVRHIITVLSPNGKITYANRVAREYTGLTLDEYRSVDVIARVIHPDDIERMRAVRERGLSASNPFEIEARTVGKEGLCRWFLYRYNPLRDEHGQITRWYVAGTDIEDRKRAEERLQQENVALREEIDKASMFEEIVGTSKPLKAVLSHTAKVARTDSTVLITGETGTGKELIARAVHKRSERSERAFISVNCAAFAPSLISSELFGHEKGAFTGATQRRLGRFELADGGTIFLDEVGELPPDTQVMLLRVLQEREFERVGGTQPIKVDVRVITATNRDLNAAVSSGSFRSDLFYRLQVFPIEIPPLRERREDIALLVEYFIDRYARKAGKNIRHVSQETLELLQSYAWPGNIRELQNVIERSVILCETETFSIDESWLPQQPQPFLTAKPENEIELPRRLEEHEKDMIEEALRASRGRVFGPTGAAAKLGIPRSTLESKIKSLKIDKNRFRTLSEI
jgi:formate hydrogenlyase transcriptional activator